MQITRQQIKKIIREETLEVLSEISPRRRRGRRSREQEYQKQDFEAHGIFPSEEEKFPETKRTLYHIAGSGGRPRPVPKMKWIEEWDAQAVDRHTGEKTGEFIRTAPDDSWKRHWLDQPVESGIFLTPNWQAVSSFHGRIGHVYAFKVPEWVIEMSGGIHRYDHGTEVLISEEIWNGAGDEIEFLGKSMDADEVLKQYEHSMSDTFATVNRMGTPRSPSWMDAEELAAWEAKQKEFNLYGLRQTNHPKDVIKLLKPDEVKAAMVAFEKVYPEALTGKKHEIEWEKDTRGGKRFPSLAQIAEPPISTKDQELIDLLRKRIVNESWIQHPSFPLLLKEQEGVDIDVDVVDRPSWAAQSDHTVSSKRAAGSTYRQSHQRALKRKQSDYFTKHGSRESMLQHGRVFGDCGAPGIVLPHPGDIDLTRDAGDRDALKIWEYVIEVHGSPSAASAGFEAFLGWDEAAWEAAQWSSIKYGGRLARKFIPYVGWAESGADFHAALQIYMRSVSEGFCDLMRDMDDSYWDDDADPIPLSKWRSKYPGYLALITQFCLTELNKSPIGAAQTLVQAGWLPALDANAYRQEIEMQIETKLAAREEKVDDGRTDSRVNSISRKIVMSLPWERYPEEAETINQAVDKMADEKDLPSLKLLKAALSKGVEAIYDAIPVEYRTSDSWDDA